jgi:hypothetical protein
MPKTDAVVRTISVINLDIVLEVSIYSVSILFVSLCSYIRAFLTISQIGAVN